MGCEQDSRPQTRIPVDNLTTLVVEFWPVPPTRLTIHEAAATTGWSSRMLRYIEEAGLVVPRRSDSGYRLYGPAELQRLRTLRELLESFGHRAQ